MFPVSRQGDDYEYEWAATRWTLLWEDDRYRDGVIPDESAYLEASDYSAFPDDGITPAPPLAR